MITLFVFLHLLRPAAQIDQAIAGLDDAKHLTSGTRAMYAFYIAEAAEKTKTDPWMITAIIWHESQFYPDLRSPTNDYGLMQVHWQKLHPEVGETWLEGLQPQDLFDPRTNILAGARVLAHHHVVCRSQRHRGHDWVGHYKWGRVILSDEFANNIQWRITKLHRSRGPARTS